MANPFDEDLGNQTYNESDFEQPTPTPRPSPGPRQTPKPSGYKYRFGFGGSGGGAKQDGGFSREDARGASWSSSEEGKEGPKRDKFGNESAENARERYRQFLPNRENLGAMSATMRPRDTKSEIQMELAKAESSKAPSAMRRLKTAHGSAADNETAARDDSTKDDVRKMVEDGTPREDVERYIKDVEMGKLKPGTYKKGKQVTYSDQHMKEQKALRKRLGKGLKSNIPSPTKLVTRAMRV
jgi:hypothetical protein